MSIMMNDVAGGSTANVSTNTTNVNYADWIYEDNLDRNSSMHNLAEALGNLTGYMLDNGLHTVGGRNDPLGNVTHRASLISEIFSGSNSTLATAWEDVSVFASSMDEMVTEYMMKFTVELRNFIESSQGHEKELQVATTKANEVANEVLNQLKSSFGS